MDMITKVEMEDAVAAHGKVTARVKEIAHRIGTIRGDFVLVNDSGQRWHMDAFTINTVKPRAGMEHLLELAVRTCWSTCVPDNDEEAARRRVTRTISFPTWYLLKEGWEEREQRKARNHKRLFARLNLEHLRAAIAESIQRTSDLRRKLAEAAKLAKEPDEAVD